MSVIFANVYHMIKRLLQRFVKPRVEQPIVEEPEVDLKDIYVQLKIAREKIGEKELQIVGTPSSLGNIEIFSDCSESLNRSLMEVINVLKEKKHIEHGLFFVREIKTVSLDDFLFVEKGFYINDADQKFQRTVELIDEYYDLMKEAGEAQYGVMEHNHRHLYAYTQSLITFLEAIFLHFGE